MLRKTKILILFFTSLLLTHPSFAGFYVGTGFGPEGARFTQRSHVVRPGTFDVLDTQHFSGIGVFGSLFGGYSIRQNRLYLAGELNANISSVEYKLTNDEFVHGTFSTTRFTVKRSQGISFLPGIFLADNFLGYARIGYTNGRVSISESDPTINSSVSNRGGFRYGLGSRFYWNERWSLIMDYSQITYSKIESHVFEPFGGVTKDTLIYPKTTQVAFGIVYSFDEPKPAVVVVVK